MFQETAEGQTHSCSHKNNNTSGICDKCLNCCNPCDISPHQEPVSQKKEKWNENVEECKDCGEIKGLIRGQCIDCAFKDPENIKIFISKVKSGEIKIT